MPNPDFQFTSRADVLKKLSSCAELNIPPFMSITVREWRENPRQALDDIQEEIDVPYVTRVWMAKRKD